jgi:hypothetical protein
VLLALAVSVCALAATTTSASAFFRASSGKYPVTINAKAENQKFIAGGISVECKGNEFQGLLLGEGSQLTVRPSYTGCIAKAIIELATTVHPNGCVYNFHQGRGKTEGTVSVECPPNKTIEFEAANGCTVKVGSGGNQNLGPVTFANSEVNKPELVIVKGTVNGISYTSSGECLGLVKEGNEGKYNVTETKVDGFQSSGGVNKEVGILVV